MSEEPVYDIIKVPIERISPNPSNPRNISEEKFHRLVESIKQAPWMLKIRPIVVNSNGVILGGNQRFKACVKAGQTTVWVIFADNLSDEQQKRFILRDNVDFGKWDLEILRQHYKEIEIEQYGIQIDLIERSEPKESDQVKSLPPLGDDDSIEPEIDQDEFEESKRNFNDNSIKQIVFHLPSELYEETLKELDAISKELDCDDNSEVFLRILNFYEVSNGLSDPDNDSK